MFHVQFSDETHMEIIGQYSGPQPGIENMGEIHTWDIRWKAWCERIGTPQPEITEKWEHE